MICGKGVGRSGHQLPCILALHSNIDLIHNLVTTVDLSIYTDVFMPLSVLQKKLQSPSHPNTTGDTVEDL